MHLDLPLPHLIHRLPDAGDLSVDVSVLLPEILLALLVLLFQVSETPDNIPQGTAQTAVMLPIELFF
jgi:hypothetical protein